MRNVLTSSFIPVHCTEISLSTFQSILYGYYLVTLFKKKLSCTTILFLVKFPLTLVLQVVVGPIRLGWSRWTAFPSVVVCTSFCPFSGSLSFIASGMHIYIASYLQETAVEHFSNGFQSLIYDSDVPNEQPFVPKFGSSLLEYRLLKLSHMKFLLCYLKILFLSKLYWDSTVWCIWSCNNFFCLDSPSFALTFCHIKVTLELMVKLCYPLPWPSVVTSTTAAVYLTRLHLY